jgi:DNA-3-methyladenine glycosylase II
MSLTQAQEEISFSLKVVPPFRLDLTVWALRRRPENKMDRWDGKTYRRALVLNGKPAELAVTQRGSPEAPRLQATVIGVEFGSETKSKVTEALNWMLGLQVDLKGFYRSAAKDARLAILARRFRGLKPPRFPSLHEALVNGIACQQFTLASGIQLLNRLSEDFGPSITGTGIRAHAFPSSQDLAAVKPRLLRSLGLNRQKVRAIIELSRAIAQGDLDMEGLASLDDEAAVERLSELHGWGVGPPNTSYCGGWAACRYFLVTTWALEIPYKNGLASQSPSITTACADWPLNGNLMLGLFISICCSTASMKTEH